VVSPSFAEYYGLQASVAAIALGLADYDGPVYLFDGDSHVFNVDHRRPPDRLGCRLWHQRIGGQPRPGSRSTDRTTPLITCESPFTL
jgi:hypothetical protein